MHFPLVLICLFLMVVVLASCDRVPISFWNDSGFAARYIVDCPEAVRDEEVFLNNQYKTVYVPDTCVNVTVKVKAYVFIGKKKTLINVTLPKAEKKCYHIYGVVWDRHYRDETATCWPIDP